MEINFFQIIVICVLAWTAYWANEKLNNVPILKTIIQVGIVVVAVVILLQSLGLIGGINQTIHV